MLLIDYQNPYWKDNPRYFLELAELVKKYPRNGSYVRRLKANGKKREPCNVPKYKHLRIWIEHVTHQYDDCIVDLATRVYWVLKGLVEAPRCANINCNKQLVGKKLDVTKPSQRCYCSFHCMNTSSLHAAHANATKNKRFDEDSSFWIEVERKKKATKVRNGHDPNWANHEKASQTIEQNAKDNPNYWLELEQKRKATKVRNGHDPNWHNQGKMVKTRYEKNGGKWESDEIAKRKEVTCLQRYGYKSHNSSPIVKLHKKEGCLKKFGVEHYSKTDAYHKQMAAANEQRKAKEYATKKKNGTFNCSKAEDRIFAFLCQQFNVDDVVKQFKSEKYPFSCDFYVKPFDLYVECNFSWTHGGHQFDPDSKEDQAVLTKWSSKKSKYYDNAICTWTKRDVMKRDYAVKNNLKYMVLWTEDYEQLKRELYGFLLNQSK